MPEIQSPDPGRKLQERYDLIGTTPAPFLSPELVPVVLIDDLTEEIPGVAFATVGHELAGVAGQQPQTAISNPAGSGVILTNLQLFVTCNSVCVFSLWRSGPALSVGVVELWQDQRRTGRPAARVTAGTDVGVVGTPVATTERLADTVAHFDLPNYVMPVGSKLHLLAENNNMLLALTWMWGERGA